jgi:hypothetical protein
MGGAGIGARKTIRAPLGNKNLWLIWVMHGSGNRWHIRPSSVFFLARNAHPGLDIFLQGRCVVIKFFF